MERAALVPAQPRRRSAASGLERYRQLEPLARGGAGSVYRAFDSLTGKEIAFKRLRVEAPNMRPKLTALFEREYTTLARLAHPSIIEVYEYGVDDEGPYYTMELLSGGDLRERRRRAYVDVCRHLRDVASALALLHTRRLVHRDLSPGNVRLTGDGRAKLIDFGALCDFGRPPELAGTAPFMAPENITSEGLDQRTDLYSLGALAYWMLTGELAVQAYSFQELSRAFAVPIAPPSRFVPDLPPQLNDLVLSLLRHDPLARPASAAEVIDRLTAIADLAPEDDQRVARSYFVEPPIAGREASRQALDAWLTRAVEGQSACLTLEAASGMGRTALLNQVVRQAQLQGALVIRIQGRSDQRAHAALHAVARAAMAALPSLGHQMLARYGDALGLWFPTLTGQVTRTSEPQGPPMAAERRARAQLAVQEWLLSLRQRTALILVVDDAHHVDAESLSLFASLSREASRGALGALFSAATDEPVRDKDAWLAIREHSEILTLGPLNLAETEELVRGVMGNVPNATRLAHWLHEESHGSPLACIETLEYLLCHGAIQYAGGTFSIAHEVPAEHASHAPESALSPRWNELRPAVRGVAQGISVYGSALDVALCAQALDIDPEQAAAALDELVAHGVLLGGDGSYLFTHESRRLAVQRTLDDATLKQFHRAFGRALLAGGGPEDQRRNVTAGLHFLEGGDYVRGVELIGRAAIELSYRGECTPDIIPALESGLRLLQAQGRSAMECAPLFVPLAIGSLYVDERLFPTYTEPALDALLDLSGTRLAMKLRKLLGARLALVVGLLWGLLRHRLSLSRTKLRSFFDVLMALFGVAVVHASVTASRYEPRRALDMAAALAPFAALGPRRAANVVREFCATLAVFTRGSFSDASLRLRNLARELSLPGYIRRMPEDIRVQLLLGVEYCIGLTEALAPGRTLLSCAERLERSGLVFFRARGDVLRMLYHAFRGEHEAAERHRKDAEIHALLGGSLWSAATSMTVRELVLCQWTRDIVSLLRVHTTLDRLSKTMPGLARYRDLALGYLELLRHRPERAEALYAQVLSCDDARDMPFWEVEFGRHAEILNALGRHAEAKTRCEQAMAGVSAESRRFAFKHFVPEIQLAFAEAGLGDTLGAAARLDGLVEEAAPTLNPLLLGSLHRDRARIALLQRDLGTFRYHLDRMETCFRSTANPALIQQCESLAAEGGRGATPERRGEPPDSVPTLRPPAAGGPAAGLRVDGPRTD